MRNLIITGLLTALLPVTVYVNAQENTLPQMETMMQCPMMEDLTSMHKEMGSMMGEMKGMMESTADPAMKQRMQTKHDHMETMLTQMQKMHDGMGDMMKGGMMGGPMMQGDKMDSKNTNDAPAVVTPEDHKLHHPDK